MEGILREQNSMQKDFVKVSLCVAQIFALQIVGHLNKQSLSHVY
jgi:hypothetical protein